MFFDFNILFINVLYVACSSVVVCKILFFEFLT